MALESNEDIQNFCHNIAWLREHNGLSKRKMAALLGIDIKSLNKLESGRMMPRLGIAIFFIVQEHFGVPPEALLTSRLEDSAGKQAE